MCGLVGVVSLSRTPLLPGGIKLFKYLLRFDYLRGEHSHGIFAISDGSGSIYKDLGIPSSKTFKDTNIFDKNGDVKNCYVLLGHNRHATRGEINVANAHPFETQDGNIVGAHNGTVYSYITDRLGKNPYETDSEFIFNSISERGLKETIKKLDGGAYALTWYNYEEDSFNLLRNSERPLFIAKSGNALVYASEKWMIETACELAKVKVDSIESLPINKHYKYTIDNLEIEEVKPERFVYNYPRSYHTPYRSGVQKNVQKIFPTVQKKISDFNKLMRTMVDVVPLREDKDESGHPYVSMSIIGLEDKSSVEGLDKFPVRAYLNGNKKSKDLLTELLEYPYSEQGEQYFMNVKIRKIKSNPSGTKFYGIVDLRSVEEILQFTSPEENNVIPFEQDRTYGSCCHCGGFVLESEVKECVFVDRETFFCRECVAYNVPVSEYGVDPKKMYM